MGGIVKLLNSRPATVVMRWANELHDSMSCRGLHEAFHTAGWRALDPRLCHW